MRTLIGIASDLVRAAGRFAGRRQTPEAPAILIFKGGTGTRPGIDLTSDRALNEALD